MSLKQAKNFTVKLANITYKDVQHTVSYKSKVIQELIFKKLKDTKSVYS